MVTRENLAEWLLARCVEDGECWLWQRAVNGSGAPVASVNKVRSTSVRSFAFRLHTGTDPQGLFVIPARCNDPACVRPEHLRAVTRAQVNRWLGSLGRFSTLRTRTVHAEAGRRRSSIAMADARAMRALRSQGMTLEQIRVAGPFQVSTGTISKICRGERWKDYADPLAQMAMAVTR